MNTASLLLPDFALILCGYVVCRYTALNRSVWEPVERLVYYFLFPVLLFHAMVRTPLDVAATSGLMGAGISLGLAGVLMAYSLPHLPGLRRTDRRLHAGSAQVAFRFNSFIGLALAERLAGAQGLQWIAVLIGVCVPILNIAAVWPMVGGGGRQFAKELLRNPLVVATVSALAFNLLGGRLPEWLLPTTARIGSASIALGLMAAGAGLQLSQLGLAPRLSGGVLLIKHPQVSVSTPWAYGRCRELRGQTYLADEQAFADRRQALRLSQLVHALQGQGSWPALRNDLQSVVEPEVPVVAAGMTLLRRAEASLAVAMSGSGPSLFALFSTRELAAQAAAALAAPLAAAGFDSWVCNTRSAGVSVEA
jgi:predicted permease